MTLLAHALDADFSEPAVSALDRGFQLGDGVFDTLTAFGGRPFLGERHWARLIRHAAAIGIAIEATAIEAAMARVAAQIAGRDAIIRTTVTRGQAARGLWPSGPIRPTVLVTAQAWSVDLLFQPARLALATVPRNERSQLSCIKSLGYLDNILAAREAAEAGCDDALIRNIAGHAVCSTIANLFALKGSTLLTPPLADGVLDGVMRELVMAEAAALGWRVEERSLDLAVLFGADAVFLTNSVRFIRRVTAIDGRPISQSEQVARLSRRLLDVAAAECGVALSAPSAPVA